MSESNPSERLPLSLALRRFCFTVSRQIIVWISFVAIGLALLLLDCLWDGAGIRNVVILATFFTVASCHDWLGNQLGYKSKVFSIAIFVGLVEALVWVLQAELHRAGFNSVLAYWGESVPLGTCLLGVSFIFVVVSLLSAIEQRFRRSRPAQEEQAVQQEQEP